MVSVARTARQDETAEEDNGRAAAVLLTIGRVQQSLAWRCVSPHPWEERAVMSPTTASGKGKTSRGLAVLGQLVGKIPYRVGWQVAWPEAAPGMGRKGPLAQAPGLDSASCWPLSLGLGWGRGSARLPCPPPPAVLCGQGAGIGAFRLATGGCSALAQWGWGGTREGKP